MDRTKVLWFVFAGALVVALAAMFLSFVFSSDDPESEDAPQGEVLTARTSEEARILTLIEEVDSTMSVHRLYEIYAVDWPTGELDTPIDRAFIRLAGATRAYDHLQTAERYRKACWFDKYPGGSVTRVSVVPGSFSYAVDTGGNQRRACTFETVKLDVMYNKDPSQVVRQTTSVTKPAEEVYFIQFRGGPTTVYVKVWPKSGR